MINFAIAEMEPANQFAQLLNPRVDFATPYAFYYDKTNNVKTFYVRENDYNYTFIANFVLGGLLLQGEAPDVQPLIESCKLQKTSREVKSSLNILYRSVVDIVPFYTQQIVSRGNEMWGGM